MLVIAPTIYSGIAHNEMCIRDRFTAADTTIAGQALLYYSIGLVGYAAVQVLLRGFYAIQNTVTPVLISVVAIAINIVLSLIHISFLA